MYPNIIYFNKDNWSNTVSLYLINEISKINSLNNVCINMALTGGRSAKKIYTIWRENNLFDNLKKSNIYLTDERCVSNTHIDSNYRMILNALFEGRLPDLVKFYNYSNCGLSVEDEVNYYSSLMPTSFDFILLSMGDDGHIASVFPNYSLGDLSEKKITLTENPSFQHKRYTMTPETIASGKNIYLLVEGQKKINLFKSALNKDSNEPYWPIDFFKNAIWLVDEKICF